MLQRRGRDWRAGSASQTRRSRPGSRTGGEGTTVQRFHLNIKNWLCLILKATVSRDGFGVWWHIWLVLGLSRGRVRFLNFLGVNDFIAQKVYFSRLMQAYIGLITVRIQYKCLVPIYVFPEMKLLFLKQNYYALSPSSYTHISVRDLYISTGSVCLFCCRKICGPILGIYKSLPDT
jgi:hypothetical protein